MKIALVRKKYTFHGGAESHMQKLAEALASRGHELHIFAAQWDASFTAERISVHKVPSLKFNSILRDLTFAAASYSILKKQRTCFDIIQSHDKTLYQDIYFAGDGCHVEWLKKRRRHSGLFTKLSIFLNPYHRLVLALERSVFEGHRFRKIVAISDLVKKEIISNYRVDPKDIEVVYHGIDTETFNPGNRGLFRDEIRKKHSIGDEEQTVLFVGSGFERKGLAYLLRAIEICPRPLTALIAGKGRFSRYEHFVKRQRVIHCGPQPDIRKYYAAADLCVIPAIYEPFGLVHLEALASGLPVITTRRSGGSELITDNVNGYVVDTPEDTGAIAEKIEEALAKGTYETLRKNARTSAEKFTFDRHVERMTEIYRSLKLSGS